MNIQRTLTRPALLATLIAATGLPASAAWAQFKVEYKDQEKTAAAPAPDPAPAPKDGVIREQRVIVISSDEGEHRYEIKVVNGTVKVAKVDGKALDPDRVRISGDTIALLDDGGKAMHEFTVPGIAVMPPPPPAPPTGAHIDLRPNITWFSDSDDQPQQAPPAEARPKVMLGINLSEPSPALRKQLKLGDDQQVILVERVIKGLPADKAGLEDYDVIVSIDGSDQANGQVLQQKLREKNPGDALKLVILRAGQKQTLDITLAAYDPKLLSFGTGSDMQFEIQKTDPNTFELRPQPADPLQTRKFPDIEVERREHQRQMELAQRMQEKAMDAMNRAQRQILEFKDGKLILRSGDELADTLDQLQQRFLRAMPDQQQIDARMQDLEQRLNQLESRLDQQMDQMGDHMDRLSDMFAKIMDRLEGRKGNTDG